MSDSSLLTNGPRTAATTLVLAHGAGAAMDSPFMNTIAEGVAKNGIRVVRFEFPYMATRRREGTRRAPDRTPVLLDSWRDTIREISEPAKIVIGGKSLGGRMASMVADELGVRGLVCLGYPFHAPGTAANSTRIAHLEKLRTPCLILQGERDSFGHPEEVARYKLSPKIRVMWMPDGDHSLKPRASSGRTEAQNLADAIAAIGAFIGKLESQARTK
jgi:predicted alpha/beta-hydrolase family hydrolase